MADVLDSLLDRLKGARREGNTLMAFCPAHADGKLHGRRSLSIAEGDKGVLLRCYAGCQTADIVAALGMRMSDLFFEPLLPPQDPPISPTREKKQTAEYVYRDENGEPLYAIRRYEPKSFSQHAWVDGGWAPTLGDVRRVLYRLPELVDAIGVGAACLVVEGEKDADRLRAEGFVATTTSGGAGQNIEAQLTPLANAREVIILPDNDDTGRSYGLKVARGLKALNPSLVIRFVDLPVEPKGDVSDFLDQRPVRALHTLIAQAPEWDPDAITLGSFGDYCHVHPKSGVSTFQPSRLAAALQGLHNITLGIDGVLYRYSRGVYVGDGMQLARVEAARVMGDEYRQKRVDEVVAWLRDQPAVAMDGGDDRERYVNVRNGLLDWRAGKLLKHTPAHFGTIQLPVTYDPTARCPAIHDFLHRFSPDASFMYEILGLLMIPHTDFRKAWMFYGPSGTGKSTWLDIVRAFLGDNNVSGMSLHKLSEDRFSTSALDHKLANIYADLDARGVESSATFKTLAGGRDLIAAERKFGAPYQYRPTARLLFSANEMPGSRDQTDAWYERWIVVPFVTKPTAAEYDPKISDRLTTPAELSGALNQAVLGLRRLIDRGGFELPEVIAEAKAEYQLTHDTVKGFAEPGEGVRYGPGLSVERGDLYDAYVNWCKRNGRHALPQARFTRKFREEAGDAVEEYKSNGKRGFRGVTSLAN